MGFNFRVCSRILAFRQTNYLRAWNRVISLSDLISRMNIVLSLNTVSWEAFVEHYFSLILPVDLIVVAE